jgi:Leucine-rich repeat (LRR) protein
MTNAFNEKAIVLILAIMSGCSAKSNDQQLLQAYLNKEKVEISLTHLKLDRIPKEIGVLKDAKELTIFNSDSGWAIYPPFSAMIDQLDKPPFEYIPEELCDLTQLESLSLMDLNLKELPECFGKLQNLKKLNLSMNKINVANELGKLSKLKSLNRLDVLGNKIDTTAIEKFQKENPQIDIRYSIEPTIGQ